MLQDVGVSWERKNDANRQTMALNPEELADVITAWPLLSADLRQAILEIVRLVKDDESPDDTLSLPNEPCIIGR